MEKHQFHFGRKFYQAKDGYWICTHGKEIRMHAHRWVWKSHHGEIPSGFDVHHRDEDKSNNSIDNLQLLTRSDHLKEHWKDPEARAKRRAFLTEIRPMAHKWLRSEEGRETQRKGAIEGWKKRQPIKCTCLQCQKEFEVMQKGAKFCSDACRMQLIRDERRYFEDRICVWCSKTFQVDKTTPHKFCSISCGAKNSAKNRTKKGMLHQTNL